MEAKEEMNAFIAKADSLKNAAELTNEELQQVSGGNENEVDGSYDPICPFCCQMRLRWWGNDETLECDFYKCPTCGKMTYYWEGARWEKGWPESPVNS